MANVYTLLRTLGVNTREMEPPPSGLECERWLRQLRDAANSGVDLETDGVQNNPFTEYVVVEHGSARGEQYTLIGGVVVDSESGKRRLTQAAFAPDGCYGDEEVALRAEFIPARDWFPINRGDLPPQAIARLSDLQIVF